MGNGLKKIKNYLYYYFAEKNWGVRREYGPYVSEHQEEHRTKRWKHWLLLVKLNIHYRVLHKSNYLLAELEAKTSKKIPKYYPESRLFIRDEIDKLVDQLMEYDVVSFDIFDTLVFRPLNNPKDVFYLLEAQNQLFNFKELRIKAEEEARRKTKKPSFEVDIFDIYDELSHYYNIDSHTAALAEIQTEIDISYPNAYMKEVYDHLVKAGKPIIAVSDMYIPGQYIKKMLDKCGYTEIKSIFVSCDYGNHKINGKLQQIAEEQTGKGLQYIHIGDNYVSDVTGSCKNKNWNALHYRQCHELGNRYRAKPLSSPVANMYNGIVNNHIHCGKFSHSELYEFGYIYAGILTCGMCEWIDDFAKQKQCDKLFFMARDMDVFYKTYDQNYGTVSHEYVVASRFALQQLIFDQYPQEYIFHTIRSRCGRNKTIENAFDETDMSFLKQYTDDYKLPLDTILDQSNLEIVTQLIYDHKEEITTHFAPSDKAARDYFKAKLGDAKKVCVIDLGWRGSEIAYLKYLIEQKWKFNVEVVGVVLGSTLSDCATSLLSRGVVTSYAYNNTRNRDFLRTYNWEVEYINLLLMESVFSSEEASLIKYDWDEKKQACRFIQYDENPNAEQVRELQNGILDFAAEFSLHRGKYKEYYPLTAVDAFDPMHKILVNYSYIAKTLGEIKDTPFAIAGFYSDMTYVPIGQLLKERNMIPAWPLSPEK